MSSYPRIYITGLREIDDEFHKMIAVRDACFEADIDIPQKVFDYFGFSDIDMPVPDLRIMKFAEEILAIDGGNGDWIPERTNEEIAVLTFNEEMRRMFEIDLRKLPTDLETLTVDVQW